MKVFLSYPSEHETSAREVFQFVRSVDIDCWFDKESIVAGEDWERARSIAQRQADAVILLCGSQTTGRNGVYQREVSDALEAVRDRRLGAVYILPVKVEQVELPPELSRFQYVDLKDINWKRRLAGGLKRVALDKGEIPSPSLLVAGASPDEGGIVQRQNLENRTEGDLHLTWFQYSLQGEYWEFVNSVLCSHALNEFYTARRHLAEWWKKSGSYWEMDIQENYRKGDIVSIYISFDSYYSGAAHPNHGVETINILGPDAGIVTAADIFDHNLDALKFISEYAAMDVRRQFLDESIVPSLNYYAETYGWELFNQFTFNEAGMRLNLSTNSGLPHVLGTIDVYVPWESVNQYLSPACRHALLGDA